jgi:protease-4
MKQFLLTMAGVFAGLVIFLIGIPFLLIVMAASATHAPSTPAHAVLQLDLRQDITDQDAQNPLAAFQGGGLSVMSIIETLRKAETDDKVKAVFVRLPEGGIAPAAADELREAFWHFRKVGKKPIWAYSQGLYPSGMVTSTYMLGAAADQFWMQPSSSFQATGIASEDVFFKRAFDKYGVTPQYQQRYQYKNAVNPYLYSDYTPAHREAQLSWMGSIYRSAILTAAADRHKEPNAFLKTIEAGPYSAEQAMAAGLIDRVGQEHDAEVALTAATDKLAEFVDFNEYASRVKHVDKAASAMNVGSAIAVIGGEGAIMTGTDESSNPFAGGQTIYSDDFAGAIYDAIDDREVKAIVLRVSSPGGSDTASEQILAAVRAAKAAGKPVVVSMGTYAASGGYWISSQASEIVAQPTTLTGSIGVFGGKFVLSDALGKFGVDMRHLSVGGTYASAFGPDQKFTPQQEAAFSGWMDRIYAGFVQRVADGRKLPVARVQEIAKGHVWTGAQGKTLGLVDHLGGFYDAVDRAKALAGLKGEVRLKHMRATASPFDVFQRALGVSSSSIKTLAASAWLRGDPRSQAINDERIQARLRSQGATVLAPTPVH